jgi:uncharacterized membrane protein (UPF0136 family)
MLRETAVDMLVTALSTQLLVSSVVREEQLRKTLDMLVTALSTQLLVSSVVREEQLRKQLDM